MRLVIAFILILLAAGCDRQKASEPQPEAPAAGASAESSKARFYRSHAGEATPNSAFVDPEGAPVTLADFSGKPLLLNLWATWCAPCVAEMPALDGLAKQSAGKMHVLTVSQNMEGEEAEIGTFFKEHSLSALQPYRDPEFLLMEKLGVAELPTTILYDSKGREIWRVTGGFDWTSAKAAKLLAEAS